MQTESVTLTIRPLPGAFGKNPPCIVNTPIGRRIADSLESAILLAEGIGAGIVKSRLSEDCRDSASLTYEINGNEELPNGFDGSLKSIEVKTTATSRR